MARFVLAGVAGAIRACGPGHAPRPRGMISAVSCSTVMVVSPLLRMSSAKRGQRKPGQGEGCRSATEKERCHGLHEVAATEWGRGGMGAPIVYSFRLSRHPLSISFCRKCSLSLTRKKTWVRDASCTGSSSRGAACAREASARAYRSYSPLCSSFVWIEFFNSWVALMVLARAAAAAAQQRRRKANAPERGGLHAPCTAPFVVAKDVFSRSQSNGFETAEREFEPSLSR